MFGRKEDKKPKPVSKEILKRKYNGVNKFTNAELEEEKKKLDKIIENFCADIKNASKSNSQKDLFEEGRSEQKSISKSLNIEKIDTKVADLLFFRMNELEKKNDLLEKEMTELKKENENLKKEYHVLKKFSIEKACYASSKIDQFKVVFDKTLNVFKQDLNKTYERQIATQRLFEKVKNSLGMYVNKDQMIAFHKSQDKFATKNQLNTVLEQQANFSTKDDLKKLEEKQAEFSHKDELPSLMQECIEFSVGDKLTHLDKKIEKIELDLIESMRLDTTLIHNIDKSEWSVFYNLNKESCS